MKHYGICDIANDNSDQQVVISGIRLAVEKAIELSKSYGVKRAIMLPVSAPFHCKLMNPAQLIMEEALNLIKFKSPLIPVVSNVTASPENDPIRLKENLIHQVTGTVRWRETMNLANKLRVKKIMEIGTGNVLTGIAKRMIFDVETFNFEKPNDFENLI